MTTTTPVQLVGIGPGDPLLLTRRAADLLADAEVVVADRRSAEPIAALAPARAERVYVGRTTEGAAWELGAVVALLAEHARAGRKVVRLKSGDPFVCSRGGEERDALEAAGIPVEVTPGVTAATAVPLAAGVPRGTRVAVASGDDDPRAVPVPWAALADDADSLVVLTGRAHQGPIARTLQDAGLDAATPVALVHAATRPEQQVVLLRLDELGATRLPAPAAFVVGPTAGGSDAHP